jgi:hypothetical protein
LFARVFQLIYKNTDIIRKFKNKVIIKKREKKEGREENIKSIIDLI